MALQRFHQLDPSQVSHLVPQMRNMLCDRDPSVMGASLNLLLDLIKVRLFFIFGVFVFFCFLFYIIPPPYELHVAFRPMDMHLKI